MTDHTNHEWLERLDAHQDAPNDYLGALVVTDGSCMKVMPDGDRPGWLFDDTTDRATAARICSTCLVRDECLELELRLFGEQQLGMWGALGETGRADLHPQWQQHRRGGEAR